MSNTQADRLAEQIRSIADKLPNIADCDKAQIGLYKISRELAALAKQQEAQPVTSDGHLIAPTPIHPQPANPAKTCDGSLCMQSNRCSYTPCQSKNVLTPSAPQAAGPQVREQAALPAPQEKELRRMLCAAIGGGLAYMDDGEAQFESIDFLRWPVDAIQSALKHRALRFSTIAQGTTPAAGVGEQAQAEPMSDERIDLHFDNYQNDRRILGDHAAFIGTIQDILAEAGIKEKT